LEQNVFLIGIRIEMKRRSLLNLSATGKTFKNPEWVDHRLTESGKIHV